MENFTIRIKEIMAVVFDLSIEDIPDDAEPLKIEKWDSLNHLQLIVALEEEFKIKFTDEELVELLNIPLINSILMDKISEK